MSPDKLSSAGEELVKQELITREELAHAQEQGAKSGTPWYKQLIQSGKVPFGALDDVLRYEFHPRAVREEQQSLGTSLLKAGAISEEQLKSALAQQKRSGRLLGAVLLEGGYCGREQIGKVLAAQHKMEYTDIERTPSQKAAIEEIPEALALKNEMIPISIEGDKLTVLITNPQNREKLKSVGTLLGKRIYPLLSSSEDIKAEIAHRYKGGGSLGKSSGAGAPRTPTAKAPAKKASSKTETSKPEPKRKENKTVAKSDEQGSSPSGVEARRFDDIAREASGASVVKMVSTIIEGAVNSGATDIHLDPQDPETRVRYRIDGVLHDVMSIPENLHNAVVSRLKIMSDLDITETRHPQDGHISTEIGDREFDIRVATLPTFLGERMVLRLLDQSSVLSGIRDLGLEADDEKTLQRLIDQPYGMILVTGPTGSGKTTTLYAALNQKNVMTESIVTLEDPVEYQVSGINQVQIDTDIDLTFANTLRASLRQDIDVLLVGEIRDSETARIAIRAAMTGHLVFSTLHTNDAPEAISTLRNMGVPSYLIASALTTVIGQRLVRTICSGCAKPFKPSATLLKSIGLPATVKKLYRGVGCDHCYGTGNRGRTGIFEILEIMPEVRKSISQDESTDKVAKTAKLKTMAQRCRQKVLDGVVTPEEFLRVIRT